MWQLAPRTKSDAAGVHVAAGQLCESSLPNTIPHQRDQKQPGTEGGSGALCLTGYSFDKVMDKVHLAMAKEQ